MRRSRKGGNHGLAARLGGARVLGSNEVACDDNVGRPIGARLEETALSGELLLHELRVGLHPLEGAGARRKSKAGAMDGGGGG